MPHKRAKRSTREQQRSQAGHDNTPGKSTLSSEAIPKGAARVLNAWKVQEAYRTKRKLGVGDIDDAGSRKKRQRVATEDKQKATGGQKNDKAKMKIQPGESLAHFNKRVEDSLRPLVRDAMQTSAAVARKARKEEEEMKAAKKATSSTGTGEKKKELEPRKQAPSSSKAKPSDEEEPDISRTPSLQTPITQPNNPKDFPSYSASAPRRLNDIVQAPPELKKLPRGAKPRQAVASANVGSGTMSLREGVLSMAQKAMMEEERDRVIKAYREMKKRNAGE